MMTNFVYKVNSGKVRRDVFIYSAIVVNIMLALITAEKYIKTDFDYHETFKHLGAIPVVIGLFIPTLLMGAMALAVGWLFNRAYIEVKDGNIFGVNFWCIRKSVPINSINGMRQYNVNGIKAVIITSKKHGSIYISEKTENFEHLINEINSIIKSV